MTGLSLEDDALIEVAALVTDFELTSSATASTSSSGPPDAALEQMDDFVREHAHRRPACSTSSTAGTTMEDGAGAGPRLRPRVGPRAAQGAARRQHRRHRPGLPRARHARARGHLHYRIIDVSSIKELSRRWYPRAYFDAPAKKSGGHRALADIRESIAELRYYREAVFVPPPGPDSEKARTLAARHVVDHATPVAARPLRGARAWSRAPAPTGYYWRRFRDRHPLPVAPVVVGVAQLVEHRVVVAGVAGSSPVAHPMPRSP